MLVYVAMILNHHRLCQHHQPHMLLNLVELFQATQQIGALQVRVKQTLSQVLFTSFHRDDFWSHWGQWLGETLQGWTDQVPAVCLTPGLLPLQPGEASWAWRERVVIQALALEAAHQLVESLPLSAESLEMLLGLQDALVEDSSTVDPKGFEMVPLGLPLLPEAMGEVTSQSASMDPALQHLPQVRVVISPQSPQIVSAPHILSHWLWEMTRQFGPEVGVVGLVLVAKMGRAALPWQEAIAFEGTDFLPHFEGESDAPGAGYRLLVRRLTLIQRAMILWQEQRLDHAIAQVQEGFLWRFDPIGVEHALVLDSPPGAEPGYQTTEMAAVRVSVAPGIWCDRLRRLYGGERMQSLLQFSQMADQLLQLNPVRERLACGVGVFLLSQFWLGTSHCWRVGTLLEAVETPEKIHALASNSIRRDSFFQAWNRMLALFQGLGWLVSNNPIPGWETSPLSDLGWLEATVSIQLQALETQPPMSVGDWGVGRPEPMPTRVTDKPRDMRRMGQISSAALERALAVHGMSQAKLARSLNLDRSTINRWINGSRPIHPRYRPLLWELLGAALQES